MRGLALTVALIGVTACLRTATSTTDTVVDESSTTMSSSTTVSDTSESSQASTETDTGNVTFVGFASGESGESGDPFCPCDTFLQDCPDGEKCVPFASGGDKLDCDKCVPVLGDGQPGEPCVHDGIVEGTDDCGPTSQCFNLMDVDGQSVGVCTPFCQGTADDPICPMGTTCLITDEGATTLCMATCNPLMQDCGPGLGCFAYESYFFCLVPAQDIPLGQPCEQINDCAAGLVCVPESVLPNCAGSKCCASFCSLMQGALCPEMGTECVAYYEQGMVPIGYEDVGVCIIPGA